MTEKEFKAILDKSVVWDPKKLAPFVDPKKVLLFLGACDTAVPFKKGDLIPFQLTYFQGPRTQISLTLMWRKIDGQSLSDCGSSDGYFSASGLPASLADNFGPDAARAISRSACYPSGPSFQPSG